MYFSKSTTVNLSSANIGLYFRLSNLVLRPQTFPCFHSKRHQVESKDLLWLRHAPMIQFRCLDPVSHSLRVMTSFMLPEFDGPSYLQNNQLEGGWVLWVGLRNCMLDTLDADLHKHPWSSPLYRWLLRSARRLHANPVSTRGDF
jgi:hypothetical protein